MKLLPAAVLSSIIGLSLIGSAFAADSGYGTPPRPTVVAHSSNAANATPKYLNVFNYTKDTYTVDAYRNDIAHTSYPQHTLAPAPSPEVWFTVDPDTATQIHLTVTRISDGATVIDQWYVATDYPGINVNIGPFAVDNKPVVRVTQ
jgi:hypothetical protein